MTNEAIERLRIDLKSKQTDLFKAGDVIRWMAGDRYEYAAIKTSTGRWYTTARPGNSFVDQVLDYDELLEVLGRSEANNIVVATGWMPIIGEVDPFADPLRSTGLSSGMEQAVDRLIDIFQANPDEPLSRSDLAQMLQADGGERVSDSTLSRALEYVVQGDRARVSGERMNRRWTGVG
jgi:hypothetical protein